MSDPAKKNIRVEIKEVSEADNPPKGCPSCGSEEYVRKTYYYRELYELGDINTQRKIKYEAVTWECNQCGVSFSVDVPNIPPRTKFMPSVVEYSRHRILKKGDSARRVSEDLNELHNVPVSAVTVNSWVKEDIDEENPPNEFNSEMDEKDFSGVMSVDGTFKSVKAKKNARRGDGSGPLLLHLTRLEDGRLAAYWHKVNPKKK